MSESLTEGGQVAVPASNEPTENQQVQNPTAETNQETISGAQSQEAVSDDSSVQKPQNDGAEATDDGLAKFAKSQGYTDEEYSSLSDREKKLLKVAHDNVKEFRNSANQPKVNDVASELNAPKDDATEDQKFRSEFQQFKYEQKTNQFWSAEGRNRELEPAMVQVLNEAKTKHGPDYAKTLSNDLETLYDLAQLRSGALDPSNAKEQGRREARDSIRNAQTASAPAAHAVTSAPTSTVVTAEWLENTYDPTNPEHRELVDSMARSDLY